MPTYDYRCVNCNGVFEATHRMSDDQPPCPQCGGTAERVFLYAPAVHGFMARGREAAACSLEPPSGPSRHGPNCPCCHPQTTASDK